ncbi:MAG: HAD family hydrolase, partial [Solirubrobacteraceae bacterium]
MSRAVIDTSPADGVAGPIVAAVAFDFNGTLADDEPILESIFRELLAAQGVTLTREDYYGELAGLSDREIAERGLAMGGAPSNPQVVAELVEEKVRRYRRCLTKRSPLRPGAGALVRALAARVPVAVVSG